MSRRRKRLQRFRSHPKNVTFQELRELLESYGIILERVRGSHHIFAVDIDGARVKLPIPFQRPVKVAYVKLALDLIDKVLASVEAEEDENGAQDDDQPENS